MKVKLIEEWGEVSGVLDSGTGAEARAVSGRRRTPPRTRWLPRLDHQFVRQLPSTTTIAIELSRFRFRRWAASPYSLAIAWFRVWPCTSLLPCCGLPSRCSNHESPVLQAPASGHSQEAADCALHQGPRHWRFHSLHWCCGMRQFGTYNLVHYLI